MTDIVERLGQMRTELDLNVVDGAIAEITRLRRLMTELQAVAGAATAAVQSFNDIKNSLRPMTAEQAEDISRRST